MIQELEKRFHMSRRPAVIQRGCQVHDQHGRAEDDRTCEKRDVAMM
jgi:hypothetical protein